MPSTLSTADDTLPLTSHTTNTIRGSGRSSQRLDISCHLFGDPPRAGDMAVDVGLTPLAYAAHPSIVHRIAQYACPRTKLALRATSRSLRHLLDPGIFEHVILSGEPGAERLRSPAGHLPGAPWHLGDPTWLLRLPYVRVLDLQVPPGSAWEMYKAELSGLEVVRGANHLPPHEPIKEPPFERQVDTMVDTLHLCGAPPAPLCAGPARKHVINILFDPYAAHIPHAIFAPGTASHIVLVFSPHHCTPARGRLVARAHNLLCSVLGQFITALWRSAIVESVTFVGVAELDLRSLGLSNSFSVRDVEEAVRAAFVTVAFQEPMTHDSTVVDFLATVKFASRAAYRVTVGERRYFLETGIESTERSSPLDHTCYPHILERVLALAPWDSLLRLRRVSRSLKERIDAVLFKHLVVLPGSLPYILFVRGAGGRLPAVSTWNASHRDCLVDIRNHAFFQHTRLLDIPAELDAGIAILVSALLPNLEVVRNFAPKHTQLMHAETEVHYQPLSFFAQQNIVRFVPSSRACKARLVITHLYDAALPTASEMPSVSSVRGHVDEVVIVFSAFKYPTSSRARSPLEFFDHAIAYFVSALNRRRISRETAKLKFVGVGEMVAAVTPRPVIAIAPTEPAERARAEVRNALLDPAALGDGRLATLLLQRAFEERGAEWRVPTRGDAADHLIFMSRDEYITDEAASWATEVPPLEAMYAAGWTPARS
ncbi:unnamed protein product [Cutaneotrichosporon oleaginosum]